MAITCEDLDTVTGIQAGILEYLAEHPGAADSVDGIRTWWLLRRIARFSSSRVQQALDGLEQAELVRRIVLEDGGVLYRRNEPDGVATGQTTITTNERTSR